MHTGLPCSLRSNDADTRGGQEQAEAEAGGPADGAYGQAQACGAAWAARHRRGPAARHTRSPPATVPLAVAPQHRAAGRPAPAPCRKILWARHRAGVTRCLQGPCLRILGLEALAARCRPRMCVRRAAGTAPHSVRTNVHEHGLPGALVPEGITDGVALRGRRVWREARLCTRTLAPAVAAALQHAAWPCAPAATCGARGDRSDPTSACTNKQCSRALGGHRPAAAGHSQCRHRQRQTRRLPRQAA